MIKKLICTALMSASLFVMAGCDAAGSSIENPENTLFFIPIVDTGTYWSVMRTGAEREAAERGWELVVRTTTPTANQKNERHLDFVQDAISNNVAGIAVAPMDPDMFDRRIEEAANAGIPVVTFDTDVATISNRVSYVGTDNVLAGQYLGRRAAEHLISQGITEGSIAMVMTNSSQTTFINRQNGIVEGFNEAMEDNAGNFRWLSAIADDDQAAISMQQLEGQMVDNADMVAVFSLGSEGPTVGTMQAIRSLNRGFEIHHFGFDFTPTWLDGVEEGLVVGIVKQDSYEIGRQVIRTLIDAAEGRSVQNEYSIPVEWILANDIEQAGIIIQDRMSVEALEEE